MIAGASAGMLDEYGPVLMALADPSRRLVFERLAVAGEGTHDVDVVGELRCEGVDQ